MFKQSWHKVVIKMVDGTNCSILLCNKDIEELIKEREDRNSRIMKVECDDGDGKYTDYLNKDLIRDIEVY